MEQAASYVRVSSSGQADRYGLEAQIEAIASYAEAHELEIVKEYSDIITGRTEQRPGIQLALEDARAGEFKHLIMLDHTRIGRTVRVSSALRDEFQSAGINLHYAASGGQYASDSEEGIILDAVSDAMSELEVRRMTRRLRSGRYRAAAAGFIPIGGHIVFGYQRHRTPAGTTLQINAAEEAIVNEIFRNWVEGKTSGEISADLNARNILRHDGGEWDFQKVLGVLHTEVYLGTWAYGRTNIVDGRRVQVPQSEWTTVPIPAIIDKATWDAAQRRHTINAKQFGRNVKHTYLLRGRVKCSECGTNYWGRAVGPADRKYFYYRHQDAIECVNSRFHVRRELLEDAVKEFIVSWLRDPEQTWDQIVEEHEQATVAIQAQLDRVVTRRETLKEDYLRGRRLLVEGTLSEDDWEDERQRIKTEDDGLKVEVQRLRVEVEPDFYEMAGHEQRLRDEGEAFDELGVEFFGFKDWIEMLAQFDIQVEMMVDKQYLISARIGERRLSVDGEPFHRSQ